MLEVESLNANYGKLHVLHDVSFHIQEGERVAIFGHNGAGKTTLLRACVGDLAEVSGTIRYRGTPILTNEAHVNVGLGVGLVQQGANVFRELSVGENLLIAGLRSQGRARADVYALFPLLEERRDQIAGSLSGGQQQMLAIGMALMTQPSILLLDEPTTGLAPVIVRDVLRTISQINQARGTTIVVVEQNVQATLEHVDRAIVLKSGRVVYDGPGVTLLEQESLWELF
jgi:branched-chain amino acid transport system ATP-binding protein